jgi:putative hemolysin
MQSVALEIAILVLLILANGVFAMSEIALVSSRKGRLEKAAKQGIRRAQAVLRLQESPTLFLSTVQVGITLIGILAGAYGGTALSETLANRLKSFSWIVPYHTSVAFGIVVVSITYASLVIGELVPKRLALGRPERISLIMAPFMVLLTRIAGPVVKCLSLSTEAVLKLFHVPDSSEPSVTEDEVRFLIHQGTQTGVFQALEKDILDRVLRLSDQPVSLMMTLRTDVIWLDVGYPEEVLRQVVLQHPHTIYPIADGSMEQVRGVVHVKDLIERSLSGKPWDLTALSSPPLFIPEHQTGLEVLEQFKQTGNHVAFVTDEHGSIEGLVTLTDLMEAIVGDMPDPGQAPDLEMVQRADGSWLLDGYLEISRVKELFHLQELPEEDSAGFKTLGGFILAYLGRIPNTGDVFRWEALQFEIVDMDGKRIDKVLVQRRRSNLGENITTEDPAVGQPVDSI